MGRPTFPEATRDVFVLRCKTRGAAGVWSIVFLPGAVRAGGNVTTMAQETQLLVQHEVTVVVDDMKGKVSDYEWRIYSFATTKRVCIFLCNVLQYKWAEITWFANF